MWGCANTRGEKRHGRSTQVGRTWIAIDTIGPRFVPSTLTDVVGNTFEIVGIPGNYHIRTKNLPDGTLPFIGAARIHDDDHLQDGQDVPIPDTSQLASAMREAFVEVQLGEGTSDTDLPFDRNCGDGVAPEWPEKWDSRGYNSEGYWVTYVVGAFQGEEGIDNDPDSEPAYQFGGSRAASGEAYVSIESIVDFVREYNESVPGQNLDAAAVQRNAVIHEVGHNVADSGDHPVTRFNLGAGPLQYTEEYLKKIRESDKPRS